MLDFRVLGFVARGVCKRMQCDKSQLDEAGQYVAH